MVIKKIIQYLVIICLFSCSVQAMQVFDQKDLISRVVLEPIAEDQEPEPCSLRKVLSRAYTSLKQCFTRNKYADSSSGRMAALLDTVTVQTLGALGGVQIAYLTSMDPSLMMLIGGMFASLLKDYLQGASYDQLIESLSKKYLIAAGTSLGCITSLAPVTFCAGLCIVIYGTEDLSISPALLSINTFATTFAEFLSQHAAGLLCVLLVIEFDLLTDFLAEYEISLGKYFNKKDWAKTAGTIVLGLLGGDLLAAGLGKNLMIGVVLFGFTLESLTNFTIKYSFEGAPQFRMVQNTLGDATSCSICWGNFKEKEPVALLPCDHVLHGDCLSRWFNDKKECPFDRKKVKPSEVRMVVFAIPVSEKIEIKIE